MARTYGRTDRRTEVNPKVHRLCQETKSLMCGFQENAKKPPFLDILAKIYKTVKIRKRALRTFFLTFQTLTSYKISEKSNEWFLRKSVVDEQIDATPRVSYDKVTKFSKSLPTTLSLLGQIWVTFC